MAFPYIPSGGMIQTAFQQFRRSLPAKVDSTTLKKLGIASSNEGAIINIMKFLGIVDENNARTDVGVKLFSIHDDAKFSAALAERVKLAYDELFALHSEGAWMLDRDSLISFFRGTDQTSSVTGARQAITFMALASLAGKRADAVATRAPYKKGATSGNSKAAAGTTGAIRTPLPAKPKVPHASNGDQLPPVGLTVRIEINLPSNGTQETYDTIFRSIRKNLLNEPA